MAAREMIAAFSWFGAMQSLSPFSWYRFTLEG
jgi:hypothetical protein